MKIKILIAVSFIAQLSFGQNVKIIVKSNEDKEVLSEVLFYSKKQLIGKTNEKGEIFLSLSKVDTIQLVKEDFVDLTIFKNDLQPFVFLEKFNLISLDEVVISKLNDQQVLNNIESRLINPTGFYNNAIAVQYFNLLTVENDTLHYLNDRMKFKSHEGNFINAQNKIIKKFEIEDGYLIYKIDNKRVTFTEDLNTYWPFIGRKDGFLQVITNRDNYNFDLLTTDDYFKISFKGKKSKKFTYEGYLIVDKLDFGIYELQMKLIPNSANIRDTYLMAKKQSLSYLINESSIFYSMTKIDNEYIINRASYIFSATHFKGDFKGAVFTNKVKVESTPNFVDEKMYKFNFLRYE